MDPHADNHVPPFGSSPEEVIRGGTALREPLLIETSVQVETRRFHCYIKIILSLCVITYGTIYFIIAFEPAISFTADSKGDPITGGWDHRLVEQRWKKKKNSNGTNDNDDVSHVQLSNRSTHNDNPIPNPILGELVYGESYNDTIRISFELVETTTAG